MNRIHRTEGLKGLLIVLTLSAVVPAQAGPVAPLTPLVAGQSAKASDVMGNFNKIVTTVNANDTRLTNVETTKQDIVSGACPAGSAIRAIAANGTVTCQNSGGTVGFASVPSIVGMARDSTIATNQTNVGFIGRYMVTAGSDFLVAPISLPHNATVTAFSFSCVRNNAASCSGFLFRDDSTQLASVSISAQAATIQTATTTSISSPVIDNQNFGYWVYMSINGTAGTAILPIRATVTYTMP
jgi:malate/lactate dehydrogenase